MAAGPYVPLSFLKKHKMTETRYIEVYEQGTGQVIGYEAYEVSDEQLQREHDEARASEILATSPDAITMPEIWELLRIFARRLGLIYP